jgi:hypothetical protein
LVLTSVLGLNSLTGSESNTVVTTTTSQLSNNQDLSEVLTPNETVSEILMDAEANTANTISAQDYSDHMTLSLAQLETITFMLQALDLVDKEISPIE